MVKLIRLIAFCVALASFWSVYSRPEVREAIMMGVGMEAADYESDYDEDDYDYDDGEYAYDDYDTEYDY